MAKILAFRTSDWYEKTECSRELIEACCMLNTIAWEYIILFFYQYFHIQSAEFL